jgi:hypothetical protein
MDHYILTSLIDDKDQKAKYYLCLAWANTGAYVLRKTEDQGCDFGKDKPWPMLHLPYRAAVGGEIIAMLRTKFMDSARMIDKTVSFKEGTTDQIYAQTPWWPAFDGRVQRGDNPGQASAVR